MFRTMRKREMAATGAAMGHLQVLGEFTDPEYGHVPCKASEVLSNALLDDLTAAAAGLRITSRPAGPGTGIGNGVLFAVAYHDRAGRSGGIALIAHRDDHPARTVARETLIRWTRTLRSRRLMLGDLSQPCPGTRRSAQIAADHAHLDDLHLLADHENTSLNGRPRRPDTLDGIPDGSTVLFPAHGVSLTLRAEAAARGMRILDGTCPLVTAAHTDITQYANRGDTVVIIGDPAHAVTATLTAQAPEATLSIRTPEDVTALEDLDGEHVAFALDPAMPHREATATLTALRTRYPRLSGHHFDIMCHTVTDHARTIHSVLVESDLTLVLTDRSVQRPAHTILEAAATLNARVLPIAGPQDLGRIALDSVLTIGLLIAPGTTPHQTTQLVEALRGLGPLSIHDATTTREHFYSAAPVQTART
uniref:4-hydroxy-3-methylbut-2-enyl diphosphate reductase n=1 Tax=Streptomyces sp. NBC_00049 TaxID=2903617 RepID=A0AAU2JZU2_9ACTN